ncbi:efflux transporter outer membrane subunit [Agarilytica rhodophyticola]|uniref:efflux transporter outer membrane subunit n=1 Tax=Agarilytica rhodophyticola TaxID=1737490 RepID=UPI0013159D92|nr:efflux transporter outer membrane subunit [Agarilytica rhodophyticola]
MSSVITEAEKRSNLSVKGLYKTLLIGSLSLLCACSVTLGPDYKAPEIENINDQWRLSVTQQLDENNSPMHSWWTLLQDDTLNGLIERAHHNNLDLNLAVSRITENRAALGIANSARVPDLSASGNVIRQKGSDSTSFFPGRIDTLRQVGVESSWEIDLWGRVRRSVESASASYQASVEDLRDILVITYADIGASYIQLRTLQTRLRLAKENVRLQQETLAIVYARNKAELAPDLEVRQAELNLAVTESFVPTIEAEISKTIYRISVLVGETPNALYAELSAPVALPAVPEAIAMSLPADVIRQRPDIRRAERLLAAQTAQIGVAKADLYPNFFLSGSFSFGALNGELFTQQNRDWNIGPFFSWNLFNAGRVRNSIKVQEARTEQALISYEKNVLSALQDVEESIVNFSTEEQRLKSLDRSVIAARQANELVKVLYRQGLTDFQNVLDTQRSLFSQEDSVATSQGTVLINLISVYRAFGGGWAAFDESAAKEPK